MSTTDAYQPINCDDYDYLESACQHHWTLTLTLRNGKEAAGKACNLFSKKGIEYLRIENSEGESDIRLDHIANFSHPKIGTINIRYDD